MENIYNVPLNNMTDQRVDAEQKAGFPDYATDKKGNVTAIFDSADTMPMVTPEKALNYYQTVINQSKLVQ